MQACNIDRIAGEVYQILALRPGQTTPPSAIPLSRFRDVQTPALGLTELRLTMSSVGHGNYLRVAAETSGSEGP
jgi:hypothetical protein